MEEIKENLEIGAKPVETVLNVPTPKITMPQTVITNVSSPSKYIQLLNVIEELGRDIRPSYAGSRISAERIKRAIVHARILVRECLIETEKSARQKD